MHHTYASLRTTSLFTALLQPSGEVARSNLRRTVKIQQYSPSLRCSSTENPTQSAHTIDSRPGVCKRSFDATENDLFMASQMYTSARSKFASEIPN
jgi:hypothetical protein